MRVTCCTFALALATAPATAAQKASPTPAAHSQGAATDLDRFHAGTRRLEELLSRIRATSDSAERRALLAEHTRLLSDQMGIVRGLGAEVAKAGTPRSRARMLEYRIEMMEIVVDQMLAHEVESERMAGGAD